MLNKQKFNNKKGFSLALSLVISLFLLMVTGGITTVAILQNNETGSDMNTRQAYISAKSGLDAMQDMLKLGTISQHELPVTAGQESFFVALELDDGSTVHRSFSSEQDAQNFLKLVKQKLDNPSTSVGDGYIDSMGSRIKAIVGGEGTYFRIKNLGDNKFSVTAENITGKYNNNVTQNKGELSFDAVITTKYVFEAEAPSGAGVIDPTTTDPTNPTTTNPTSGPSDPPSNPPSYNPSTAGKFLMVGQQTALNENSHGQGTNNGQSILLQRYQHWDDWAVTGDKYYYAPSVESGDDGGNIRTYFPVVYDHAIKVESGDDRTSMYAYNQGIYLYGGVAESVGPNSNNHVFEQLKDWYGRYYSGGGTVNYGLVSYMTQNTEYHPRFKCAFLVIKNNCITTKNSPKVEYFGSNGKGYVYVHLINDVTFFTSSGDGYVYSDSNKTFIKNRGYYKLSSGSELFNARNWISVSESEYNSQTGNADVSAELNNYLQNGTIHSGCNETEGDPQIRITNTNGEFNTGAENYSTSEYGFSYQGNRGNVNLFVSPNFSPNTYGYYRMYAGQSLNFQWFRSSDFNVKDQVHIEMSAPTIVLTIGPSVSYGGSNISASNTITQQGNGSFKLYGNCGSGSCKLVVMCDFNVKYGNTTYTVKSGTYSNVPAGLNLFSEQGRAYFSAISNPNSGGNTTGSIGNVNNSGNSMNGISRAFSSFFSSFIPTQSAVSTITGSGAQSIGQSDISGNTAITVGADVTSLLYLNVSGSGTNKHNVLDTGASDLTIKKTFSDGTVVDYITFKQGTYKIPCYGSDDTSGVNIYNGGTLKDRAGRSGNNYKCVGETTSVIILREYY
ncbi:hypothetical protein ACTQ3U_01695 [Oscillospiraceae bacterium LCP25S3_F9]